MVKIKNSQLKIVNYGLINNFRISKIFIINYENNTIKKIFMSNNLIKSIN